MATDAEPLLREALRLLVLGAAVHEVANRGVPGARGSGHCDRRHRAGRIGPAADLIPVLDPHHNAPTTPPGPSSPARAGASRTSGPPPPSPPSHAPQPPVRTKVEPCGCSPTSARRPTAAWTPSVPSWPTPTPTPRSRRRTRYGASPATAPTRCRYSSTCSSTLTSRTGSGRPTSPRWSTSARSANPPRRPYPCCKRSCTANGVSVARAATKAAMTVHLGDHVQQV